MRDMVITLLVGLLISLLGLVAVNAFMRHFLAPAPRVYPITVEV